MPDITKCLDALYDYRRFGFGMIGGPDKKVHVTEIIVLIKGLERARRELDATIKGMKGDSNAAGHQTPPTVG